MYYDEQYLQKHQANANGIGNDALGKQNAALHHGGSKPPPVVHVDSSKVHLQESLHVCKAPGCMLTEAACTAVSTGQNVYLDNVFTLTPVAGRHLVEVKLGAFLVYGDVLLYADKWL